MSRYAEITGVILYYGKAPQMGTLAQATTFAIIVLVVGMLVFGKLKRHFAEEM